MQRISARVLFLSTLLVQQDFPFSRGEEEGEYKVCFRWVVSCSSCSFHPYRVFAYCIFLADRCPERELLPLSSARQRGRGSRQQCVSAVPMALVLHCCSSAASSRPGQPHRHLISSHFHAQISLSPRQQSGFVFGCLGRPLSSTLTLVLGERGRKSTDRIAERNASGLSVEGCRFSQKGDPRQAFPNIKRAPLKPGF